MNMSILVVDSDASIRTLIRDILESRGYRVETASDLDAASVVMAEREPDLAIVSHDLGTGTDGSFSRRMERLGLSLPFILMVDASVDDPVAAVLESGAQTYLDRPVDRSRLLMAVHQGVTARQFMSCTGGRESDRVRMHAFLRVMMDSGEGVYFVLNGDGVVVECGGQAGTLSGIDVDSARGRPYLSLLPKAAVNLHGDILGKAFHRADGPDGGAQERGCGGNGRQARGRRRRHGRVCHCPTGYYGPAQERSRIG